jgi:hypothetical protein
MRFSICQQRMTRPSDASRRWAHLANTTLITGAFVFIAAVTFGLLG